MPPQLACGGSDNPSDSGSLAPTTPVVSGPTAGIGGHRYILNASSTSGDKTISYEVRADKGGSVSAADNVITYIPLAATEGLERLDVTAKDSAGATSQAFRHGFMVQPNRNPSLPQTLVRKQSNSEPVYVSPSDAVSISGFALIDDDQDAVKWDSQGGDFVTKGGTVEFNEASNTVVISAKNLKASDYGNYTAKIRSTETSAGHTVATKDYSISITVGDRSDSKLGGSESEPYGQITSFPNNTDKAVKGIPFTFQFNAADLNNSNNRAIDWWLSDGREISDLGSKAKDVSTKPSYSFISVNGEKPLAGELGPAFERWRGRKPNDDKYNAHEMIFVPVNDNTYVPGAPSSRVSFGVAAQFSEPPTVAFQNFYIEVLANTPLAIPFSTDLSDDPLDFPTPIRTTVANDGKWNGTYANEPKLVFKGASPGSFDLSTTIYFRRTITDADVQKGEVFTFKLTNVTISNGSTPTRLDLDPSLVDPLLSPPDQLKLGLAGYDITENIWPYLSANTKDFSSVDYTVSDTNKAVVNGSITFDKVPVSGTLKTTKARPNYVGPDGTGFVPVGSNGLTFTYEVTDLGDNKVLFHIYVPTRDNNEPVIDAFDADDDAWEASSGDITKGGWADKRPTEEIDTQWTLNWADSLGTVPEAFKVADPLAAGQAAVDTIYMEVSKQPWEFRNGVDLGNNVTITPSGALNEYSLPWKFSWFPLEADARKKYAFTIRAWDRYGAAAAPYDMEGVVYGTIYGTKVVKSIYNFNYDGNTKTAGVVSKPADFTSNGWASINLTEFIPENNQYASEQNQSHVYSAGGRRSEGEEVMHAKDRWKVYSIPPGQYMVSADHVDGGGTTPTSAPVIGPAVTSTDLMDSGDLIDGSDDVYANKGGNLFAYAYISSSTPNLSTNVGSGRLALWNDWSLSKDFYGFGLEWAGKSFNMAYDKAKAPLWEPVDVDKGDVQDLVLFRINGKVVATFDTPVVYTGRMAGIGAGSLVDNADAIQFSFPSIGQTAFFDVGLWPPLVGAYPVSAYDAQLGWTGNLGNAKDRTLADWDISFRPITFDLVKDDDESNDILPFATASNDLLTLSTMTRGLISRAGITALTGAPAGTHNIVNYPYWTMNSTGIVQPREQYMEMSGLDAAGDDLFDLPAQTSNWSPVETQGNFVASVTRTGFRNALRTVRPSVPGTGIAADYNFSDVKDTLRVLAYVNGTELGPVENAHGVPVYLEFGNLNADPDTYFSTVASATYTGADRHNSKFFNGAVNLGTYPIPKPNLDFWDAGGTTPVVSYIVKYGTRSGAFPGAGLTGTMGTIRQPGTAAIVIDQQPVTNVKITTADIWSSGAAKNPGATGVSAFISNAITGGAGTVASPNEYRDANGTALATVSAKAYPLNFDGDKKKVWLTWTNPTGNFSGNILEFFKVAAAGSLDDAAVPIRKVYVAPNVNRFPIPDTWVEGNGASSNSLNETGYDVVIRIRTVKYGAGNYGSLFAGNAPGTYMINFNEEPFMQALPASWIETITSRVSFTATGASLYTPPSGNLNWASNVPLVFAAPNTSPATMNIDAGDIVSGAEPILTTAVEFAVASGSDITDATNGITYTWTIDTTPGSYQFDDTDCDITDVVILPAGQQATSVIPTVQIVSSGTPIATDFFTVIMTVTYTDPTSGFSVPAVKKFEKKITLN